MNEATPQQDIVAVSQSDSEPIAATGDSNGRSAVPLTQAALGAADTSEPTSHEASAADNNGSVAVDGANAFAPGSRLQGKVMGMIKGGLEIQFESLRGFMPASQVAPRPMKDISVLLGQDVSCEVLEYDKRNKKVIVSRRRVVKEEQEQARKDLLNNLEVGQERNGVVKGLADFGAFVDLGGVQGLVHVSDLKWSPVNNPAEVVKPGDKVRVKVLKVNKDRKRISLGIKQTVPDPWSTVEQDFAPGKRLAAKVVRLAEFGAFAEVAEGINGLIPLSEMAWDHRPAKPDELVKVDENVDVVVISADAKRRRIGLSIKQLTEDPWAGVNEQFQQNALVTGKVSKLLDFGALVELKPGVEGMVHVSELSESRVRTPGDVINVGDEVTARVLSVDLKKRRIALSIKQATEKPEPGQVEAAPKPEKKRKRPLRGGLTSHFEW